MPGGGFEKVLSMSNAVDSYEVEIRCYFNSHDEACRILPFLQSGLLEQDRVSWVTRFYGLHLFLSGELLREAEVTRGGEVRRYLGWKGPDMGRYANVRREIEEEFTDGLKDSLILGRLGGMGGPVRRGDVVHELERLGHRQFMSFKGTEIKGYHGALDIRIKMMSCPVLKWPLIVEIEKTAASIKEARRREEELKEIVQQFGIEERMLKQEPPTLLYNQLFAH
jgi:adenylate cyclase class IV